MTTIDTKVEDLDRMVRHIRDESSNQTKEVIDAVEATFMNRLDAMTIDIHTRVTDDCTSQLQHIQTTLEKEIRGTC